MTNNHLATRVHHPTKPGFRYRLCRKCGLPWNASVKATNERRYICPICATKVR